MQQTTLPSCEDKVAYEPHRRAVAELYDHLQCEPPRILTDLMQDVKMERKDGLYRAKIHITFGRDMTTWSVGNNAMMYFGTSHDIKIYTVACTHYYATTLVMMQATTTALGDMNAVPHAHLNNTPCKVMGVFAPGAVERCTRVFHHALAANSSLLCREFPTMLEKHITSSVQPFTDDDGRHFIQITKKSSMYAAIEFKKKLAPPPNTNTIGPYTPTIGGGLLIPKVAPIGIMGSDELVANLVNDLKSKIACVTPSKIAFSVAELSQLARLPVDKQAPPSWMFSIELEFVFSEHLE